MGRPTETDNFLSNETRHPSRKCYLKWWKQEFENQEYLCRILESFYFRALVVFLVIVDTALVISELMLDSIKIHYECETDHHHHQHLSKEDKEISKHRVELAMEIAHFLSIGILVFFVIELIIRIYAFGKEFWNIHRKKMEYFDAFIVITSLIIDLYFLRMEKKLIGNELLLIFSFRLWRFVRIISSVAEGIRHGQNKHKQHLNKQYLIAVRRLVELLKHKTTYLENNNNPDNFDSIIEHYQLIDNQCESSLNELNQNRELTSSDMVMQFIEDIQGLEIEPKTPLLQLCFRQYQHYKILIFTIKTPCDLST